MNKLFRKNIVASTVLTATLYALPALAEIPGKYFAADLEGSDLMAIISAHPYMFWAVVIAFVAFCVGYAIYHFRKNKTTN